MPDSARPLSDASAYRLRYGAAILLCLVGAFIGVRLPDTDNAFALPRLILHRSLLTHSFLLPLLLYVLIHPITHSRPEGSSVLLSHPHANPCGRLFSLGICASVPVHLCFDLFPRAWRGWALIYAPLLGRLSPSLSVLWLSISLIACLYLACRLLRNGGDLLLAIFCVAACYGFCASREPQSARWSLLILLATVLVAFVLPRPKRNGILIQLPKIADGPADK